MARAFFTPRTAIVVVAVEMINPVTGQSVTANLLLDTGATYTAIAQRVANALSLQSIPGRERRILTATGNSTAMPLVVIDRVRALGMTSDRIEAVIIQMPASTGLDGLLGGSFLRDYRLTVDYARGIVELDR